MSSLAGAQSIYKCKQADGSLAYQSDPCPQSAVQQAFQADSRGNIKAEPSQAHGKGHSAAASAQAAKPTGAGVVEKVQTTPTSDATTNARPAQAADPAAQHSDTSVPPDYHARPGPAGRALAIIGLILCCAAALWYLVMGGISGDLLYVLFSSPDNCDDWHHRNEHCYDHEARWRVSPLIGLGFVAVLLLAYLL